MLLQIITIDTDNLSSEKKEIDLLAENLTVFYFVSKKKGTTRDSINSNYKLYNKNDNRYNDKNYNNKYNDHNTIHNQNHNHK